MHRLGWALVCLFLSACAVQRAQVADEARTRMRGMTKEQVLGCMGPPQNKATEGSTEVWSYTSGGKTLTMGNTSANGSTAGTANVFGNSVYSSAYGTASANSVSMTQQRYCIVNVAMNSGQVSSVNYSGPTGGLLTGGEQCAYAVQNCVPKQ